MPNNSISILVAYQCVVYCYQSWVTDLIHTSLRLIIVMINWSQVYSIYSIYIMLHIYIYFLYLFYFILILVCENEHNWITVNGTRTFLLACRKVQNSIRKSVLSSISSLNAWQSNENKMYSCYILPFETVFNIRRFLCSTRIC